MQQGRRLRPGLEEGQGKLKNEDADGEGEERYNMVTKIVTEMSASWSACEKDDWIKKVRERSDDVVRNEWRIVGVNGLLSSRLITKLGKHSSKIRFIYKNVQRNGVCELSRGMPECSISGIKMNKA